MSAAIATSNVIEQLRRQLLSCQIAHADQTVVSSGFRTLDQLLPKGGLPSGSVTEWVSDTPGLRATTIALRCAAGFLNRPGALAVVDPRHEFHPLSLSHLGIPTSRLLLVRPCLPSAQSRSGHTSQADLSQSQRSECLWALEQLARCAGVQVVLTWIDRLSATAQRRLQLAVEKSGVSVFLIRPAAALQQTSWADLRFHVQSVPQTDVCGTTHVTTPSHSRLSVQLVRSKNSVQRHGRVLLDCDHETGDVSETSELADSATTATAIG